MPVVTSLDQLAEHAQAALAFEQGRDAAPSPRAAWLEAIAAALERDADPLVPMVREETYFDGTSLRDELELAAFQLRLLTHEIVRVRQHEVRRIQS